MTIRCGENSLPTGFSLEVREDRPGHATVNLDLPETRLFGRVVDERGNPEPGLFLRVEGLGRVTEIEPNDLFGFDFDRAYGDGAAARKGVQRWTSAPVQLVEADGNGEFDLPHPPAGRLRIRPLRADDGPPGVIAGEAVEVEVESGKPTGPITLRTRAAGHLRGAVRQRSSPAVAVLSLAYAGFVDGEPVGTEESGEFDLDLPQGMATGNGSEQVTLVLLPKEGGMRARYLPLAESGSGLQLEVEEVAGAVRVALPSAWGQPAAQGLALEVEQDGVGLPLGLVDLWTKAQGIPADRSGSRDLTIPSLPTGRYRACVGPEGWKGQVDPHAERKKITCAEGTLAPGGELLLDLRR